MRRDNGQGFKLVKPWRIHTVQQLSERVEIIGHLSEQGLVNVEPDGTPQTFDLVL
jgi:hypothetical protein